MSDDGPLIAIVGRPNVGKSSLYNRLVGGRPALVHDTPGLTRDRRYGTFEHAGRMLRVVDTGGLDPEVEKDVIGAGIHRQAWRAIEESDVVIFLVDAAAGLLPLDQELARMLRKAAKPIVCVANKVDNPKRQQWINDMFALGLGEVYGISAAHGLGIEEVLEAVVDALPPPQATPAPEPDAKADADADAEPDLDVESDREGDEAVGDEPEPDADAGASASRTDSYGRRRNRRDRDPSEPIRVAFIGKPNAGKSSLVNRLLGYERSLVHHEPGTTTDPVDSPVELGGRSYVLVDTAGIRRRNRVEEEVEKIAISLAQDQVRSADVVVLVVDGALGSSDQDAKLAGLVEESGAAVVVALNKSDLLRGVNAGTETKDKTADILHFLPYAPVVLISAMRGDGVDKLMDTVASAAAQHRRRISTSQLNHFFAEVCEVQPPPLHRGVPVRIHYLTQAATSPPTFLLFANKPEGVSDQYRRFLANRLRERYGFKGTPLRIFVKAKVKSPSPRDR